MNFQNEDDVKKALELSKRINSKTVSLIRLLILMLLSHFFDGLQYRELKTALKISDGKLASNLKRLEDMRYIKKEETKLEQRKLTIYSLSDKGEDEVAKIVNWMKTIQNLAKVEEEGC